MSNAAPSLLARVAGLTRARELSGSRGATRLRQKRSREEAVLWLGCAVVLSVLWAVIVISCIEHESLKRRERAATLVSTAKGFSEYVGVHLLFLDRVLANVRDSFAETGRITEHEKLTASMGMIGPMLLQVAVADEQGRIVASSLPLKGGVSIADRPHFLAFAKDTRDRLYVSEPVVGRVSRKMSLQLVRPILGSAGEFRGVIVASVDPVRVQQYFDSVDGFADEGTVVIVGRNDGVVRVRFSRSEITWGQSPAPQQVLGKSLATSERKLRIG